MARDHKIYYDASPIGSLEVLAKVLETSPSRLLKITRSTDDFYTVFTKTVKNKERELAEPKSELKILQKRIISRIFCHLRFPQYLHGGIKTNTPRDFFSNALAHAKAESAITVDITSFYPSITYEQVQRVFLLLFKFPPKVSEQMAKIMTLTGSVPQGAPTSSYIANLVMWEKEYTLASKLEQQGYIYSRLIDDITVSSEKSIAQKSVTKIIDDIAKMLRSYNFKIHPDKTNIYSRSNPEKLMLITGLWLNRGSPRLERVKIDSISHAVVKVIDQSKTDIVSDDYHKLHNKVSGQVALLKRLRHKEAPRLKSILDTAKPIFNDAKISKIQKLITNFSKKTLDHTRLGYIQKYYRLQHQVSIVKRTNPKLAKKLQGLLNKKRPSTTMRSHYE